MPFTGTLPPPSGTEAEMTRHIHTMYALSTSHWVTQITRAAADLRIADHVAEGRVTAEAIAAAESSHPRSTYRLMRACVTVGILGHSDEEGFFLTPVGELLRTDTPVSMRDGVMVQGARGHWQSWGLFPEAVRSGRNQVEQAVGGRHLFDYFARNPQESALFSRSMSNSTSIVSRDIVTLLDLGDAAQVVDLGGADGELLLSLMRANRAIHGAVFDLPTVVEGARQAAEKAGVTERFTAVGGDFFETVPAADYYLLKWILHDWPDEQCVQILRNCREAARPGARVLVVEALIGAAEGPDPIALLDMNMLSVSDGQERSLAEYDTLFAAAGWRRVAQTPTRTLYWLIELEAV
ncbi:methyltransferase [Actinoplanes sp. NPDC049596]|uniref:methyltransferase n=1 Tax=unclassified Actinoplanes TaxID=2626549 RepID=UPI0034321E60